MGQVEQWRVYKLMEHKEKNTVSLGEKSPEEAQTQQGGYLQE